MSALRRWLREERAREAKEQWRADLTVRRAFRGCTCQGGPCFRFPCVSWTGADGQPLDDDPSHPLHPSHWER